MCNAHHPSALLVPITLIFLTIPVVVAIRPPTIVRALIFAGQLQVAYTTISRHRFLIGDPYHDYIGGSSFGVFLLIAFDWYFLQPDPLRDGTKREGDRQLARAMPLWKRIWWATNLIGCLRGIGWSNTVGFLSLPAAAVWLSGTRRSPTSSKFRQQRLAAPSSSAVYPMPCSSSSLWTSPPFTSGTTPSHRPSPRNVYSLQRRVPSAKFSPRSSTWPTSGQIRSLHIACLARSPWAADSRRLSHGRLCGGAGGMPSRSDGFGGK